MTLWHFTCDDGHKQITDTLRPNRGIVWLTDLNMPIRDALGLTSHMLGCDRAAHRYRVTDDSACVKWVDSRLRHLIGPAREHTLELESAPGARPMHWWVAEVPVPVVYDPIGGAT